MMGKVCVAPNLVKNRNAATDKASVATLRNNCETPCITILENFRHLKLQREAKRAVRSAFRNYRFLINHLQIEDT